MFIIGLTASEFIELTTAATAVFEAIVAQRRKKCCLVVVGESKQAGRPTVCRNWPSGELPEQPLALQVLYATIHLSTSMGSIRRRLVNIPD